MKKYYLLVITIAVSLVGSNAHTTDVYAPEFEPNNMSSKLQTPKHLEDITNIKLDHFPVRFDSAGTDSFIRTACSTYHIPGVATWTSKNGQVIWQQCYGYANLEDSTAVYDTTSFALASISKTITATAIMQLWERGVFNLDEDINNHLDFSVRNPNYPDSAITFRMLMTHTSSIQDYSLGQYWVTGDSPIALGEFVEGYLVPGGTYYNPNNYSSAVPGAEYDYCNVAVALLGYLVEAMADSFPIYCQDSIFEPLGMNHTSWFLAGLDTSNIAVPYHWNGAYYVPYGHRGWPCYPAALLRASLIDLAQHLTAFIQYGMIGSVRILDSTTVELMTTVHYQVNYYHRMGLIWMYWYDGNRWLWFHRGESSGVNTAAAFCPAESSAVIVLTNGESWNGTYAIMNALFNYAQQYVVVEENEVVSIKNNYLGATIFRGPLQLPEGKKCKVFDITGRVVESDKIQPGIYFIEVDGVVIQKVVKVR
jgi:CubicO group peptidase (beta-lactamase class C family)